jgi:hypothetical protein
MTSRRRSNDSQLSDLSIRSDPDALIIEDELSDSTHKFMNIARKVGKQQVIKKVTRKSEQDIIQRVLDEIDMISVKRMSEGFNQLNFSFGVFNCFVIVYIFGKSMCMLQRILFFSRIYIFLCKNIHSFFLTNWTSTTDLYHKH